MSIREQKLRILTSHTPVLCHKLRGRRLSIPSHALGGSKANVIQFSSPTACSIVQIELEECFELLFLYMPVKRCWNELYNKHAALHGYTITIQKSLNETNAAQNLQTNDAYFLRYY